MLWMSLGFLLISLLAAILGFGVSTITFAALAQTVFYVAAVLFMVSLIGHLVRRV